MHSKTIRCWTIALAILLTLVLVVAITAWYKLSRELEQSDLASASEKEWFKYGSIGSEDSQGIPYWIWRILPKMFPEYLPGPGGYASLGIPWEQGKELPVGFSKKTIGFPRVAFNCAFCHTATYRLETADLPMMVVPGPGHTVNAQGYARFLAAVANDARFNPEAILSEIAQIYELPWLDRLLYRYVLIPATKKALIKYGQAFAWAEEKPPWGPGRIDPFNPIKFGVLQMGLDGTIGNADMVPLWNMKAREGKALHWDGLNTDLHEVVVSSAIGDGMTYKSIATESLQRIEEWLKKVPPPRSPFDPGKAPDSPYHLDERLAATGKEIFDQHCAGCHALGGERTGTIIPVEEVGTDRHRVDMWTAEAAKRYNAYQKDYDWGMRHFQDVDGYVAVLLDGLWLRGPYLHNGSVPTVRDLLKKPEERPQVFYRGYDLIDPINLGFVSQGEKAERVGFRYDTNVPGNGNPGHLYGTDLPEDQKQALLEYLKTF
jgi:hypothetical protein